MTVNSKPEILAPAGGEEQLRAAVTCGADAVYLGVRSFNARQGAENFDETRLGETVGWCHARGVRVYVALNTLVTDRELPRWRETLDAVAASGADGVIVQDIGLAALIRESYPTLPLHASTQMTIHNLAGARLLEEHGFTQAVLAREMTREEIAAVTRETKLRTEIFVHGALCMSVSGQCYLSSVLGERSGNRGLCAQPCRLDFVSHGREYALSLKDLTLVDKLREMAALGVASFKIEGRLKRPEYVAAAVTACREALAGKNPDLVQLRDIFSRGGFTDGYYTGRRDLSMFGMRGREDVAATASVLGELAALTRNPVGHVPVDMTLTMESGTPAALTVSDGERSLTVTGELPQIAQNRPTDEVLARRSLEKCGGTPFTLSGLTCRIGAGLMLPVSALNRLRTFALEALEAERSAITPHPKAAKTAEAPAGRPRPLGAPELRCRLTAAQLGPALRAGAGRLILPLADIRREPALIEELGERLIGEMPLLVFPGQEEALSQVLAELRTRGLRRVLTGNLGGVRLAREAGLAVTGDYALNLLNSEALREAAALGCSEVTVSFECERPLMQHLSSPVPMGAIAYGHLPLMTYRNCPARTEKGCADCKGHNHIADRRDEDFSVVCRDRTYSQLLNPQPLTLSDRLPEWDFCDFLTLRFTTESAADCEYVWNAFRAGEAPRGKFTRGLYYRTLK